MKITHFLSARSTGRHRTAFLATLGILVVSGSVLLLASRTLAATKNISGRGIVRSGAGADSIPLDFILTVPVDEKLNGEQGELRISSSANVYENLGQTSVGEALQPVKTKRIRPQNVTAGNEVTFKGRYTVGNKDSVRPDVVYVHDRSFVVCGKLQGITRRTAAGANQDTLTVEVSKMTVQEKRYERFFPTGKDALFSFKDGTQFHNASGSWKAPKNRVSIQAADVTANQQTTALRGKITGNNTLDLTTVDIGAKCS
ncbi:MAG: hypothetical protein G01um101438_918 [Parcubacteria group bacterium Gr01-1014_38]|nr:MAG: hypothetical protein G01um101438_918 [Parcubacteria group bacterium Gr01-1014_38]